MTTEKNNSKDLISKRFDRNLALLQSVDIAIRTDNNKGQFDTTLDLLDAIRCGVADLKHAFEKALEPEDQPADPEPVSVQVEHEDPDIIDSGEQENPYFLFLRIEGWLKLQRRCLDTLRAEIADVEICDELAGNSNLNVQIQKDLETFYDLTAEKWE